MTDMVYLQRLTVVKAVIGNLKYQWCMRRTDKIVIVGAVWNSKQNGAVLNTKGISQCFTVGKHSGCEPKIQVIYETR